MNKERFPQMLFCGEIDNSIFFKSWASTPGTFQLKKGERQLIQIKEDKCPFEWTPHYYSNCIRYDKRIVFVPGDKEGSGAEYITILDIENMEFCYINNPGKQKYKLGVAYNECVYFFSEHLSGANYLMLNMNTYETESVPYDEDFKPVIIFNNICIVGEKIYFPGWGYSTICVFDIKEKKTYKIDIKKKDFAVATICYDGELFWLSGHSNKIFLWDEKQRSIIKEIELDDMRRNIPWKMWFSSSATKGEYIYFAPLYYDKIIKINKETYEVDVVKTLRDFEICWSMIEIFGEELYIDIYDYINNISKNIVIKNQNEIVENDKRFSVLGLFFEENIFEEKNNTLSMLINYLTNMK